MTPHPVNGWHWREWSAEFAGTGLLMFAVVTAWYWCVAAGDPWASFGVRVPILSVVAGGAVIVIAYSPLGHRSGAHLNPAVTFGLWLQRSVSPADLAGYIVGQCLGGVAGFALGRIWGPGVAEAGTRYSQIAPDPHLPQVVAALIEAGGTAVQLLVVYLLLRYKRFAPWAGVAGGVGLGVGIATLAGVTGAGFNPVRGDGPDLLAWSFPAAWIYIAGPLAGAALAAVIASFGPSVKTAKLDHDARIPCYLRCELPHDRAATDAEAAQAPPGGGRRPRNRRPTPVKTVGEG